MKKLLSLALIVIILFACSEQEELNNISNAGKTSLSVKIDLSRFKTRSGDGVITDPGWTHLLLVAKNAKGSEVREKLIFQTNFTDGGIIQIFEKDSINFAGGTVEAYIINSGNDWGAITARATANLPVLATGQTDINNWQPSGFIRTGIAGMFVNVPYYGSDIITDNGPGGDGHHQLTATVSVAPELGRIQVLNSPQTDGEKNGYKVTSLTVQNIYINRIKSNGTTIDIRTQDNGTHVETKDKWINNYYTTSKPLVGMTDIGTDKGYQIFDDSKPHIIVKITYQLNNEPKNYEGYLTLHKFTYSGITSGDLTVAKGKIYNVDLSKLTPTYDQIGDDPYDDTVYYDLNVTVGVVPWSIIDVNLEL